MFQLTSKSRLLASSLRNRQYAHSSQLLSTAANPPQSSFQQHQLVPSYYCENISSSLGACNLLNGSKRRLYSTETNETTEDSTEKSPEGENTIPTAPWPITQASNNTHLEILMKSNSLNFMNPEFFNDFHDTIKIVKEHYPKHLPLVFRSENPKVFSAGLDLKYVTELNQHEESLYFVDALNRCFTKLYLMKRPTIAVLDKKHAIAGGLIMALCADFQIVTTEDNNAQYSLKEIDLGVPFPSQTYFIIEKEISDRALFKELTLTGYSVGAKEALRRGLFSHSVKDSSEIDAKIHEIVSRYTDFEASHEAFMQLKRMLKSNPFRDWLESDIDTDYYDTEFVNHLLKDSTKDLMRRAINKGKPDQAKPKEEKKQEEASQE